VRQAADSAAATATTKVDEGTQQAIDRALDVMELAARRSLRRSNIRDVTVTAELNLVVGQVSISARFGEDDRTSSPRPRRVAPSVEA
ncbi:MAG TPA: hypothetical protein VIK91_05855, partial [Nannocystis sp.]